MARKAQITQSPRDEARKVFSLRFKDLSSALKEYRERTGKPLRPHHFSNEIRLIKRLVNGGSDRVSMDEMTLDQLLSACQLMTVDTELLMSGVDYSQRKALLTDQIQTPGCVNTIKIKGRKAAWVTEHHEMTGQGLSSSLTLEAPGSA